LNLTGESQFQFKVLINDQEWERNTDTLTWTQLNDANPELRLLVSWGADSGVFSMGGLTESEKDIPMNFVNEELDSGIVMEYVKKTYHNLTVLWIVIGVVGAALVIGVVCACIFCK